MKKTNRTDETRAKERARKQKSRKNAAARRESLGLERLEIDLSKKVRDELETLRHARALGGEPYSMAEYISELILNDAQRYQEQVVALGYCGKCKSQLPQGCEGLFDGDSECWRTRKSKELML